MPCVTVARIGRQLSWIGRRKALVASVAAKFAT